MRIKAPISQVTPAIREALSRLTKHLPRPWAKSKFQVSRPSLGFFQPAYPSILMSFKRVIGYSGYISGVGPENVYGKTYSRATQDSSSGTITRGIDQAPNLKY